MRSRIALAVVVWGICGCSMADEKTSVDTYLKENLNDADYEVVAWFNAVPLKGAQVFSPPPDTEGRIPRMSTSFWKEVDTIGRAIRLKYRARNALGAKILHDEVFMIDGNGDVIRPVSTFDFRQKGETPEAWGKRTGYDRTEQFVDEAKRSAAQGAYQNFLRDFSKGDFGKPIPKNRK